MKSISELLRTVQDKATGINKLEPHETFHLQTTNIPDSASVPNNGRRQANAAAMHTQHILVGPNKSSDPNS